MIVVFFPVPLILGATSTINPAITRAASAAVEAINTVEWLVEAC
jgi:hypothetical protein